MLAQLYTSCCGCGMQFLHHADHILAGRRTASSRSWTGSPAPPGTWPKQLQATTSGRCASMTACGQSMCSSWQITHELASFLPAISSHGTSVRAKACSKFYACQYTNAICASLANRLCVFAGSGSSFHGGRAAAGCGSAEHYQLEDAAGAHWLCCAALRSCSGSSNICFYRRHSLAKSDLLLYEAAALATRLQGPSHPDPAASTVVFSVRASQLQPAKP